MSAADELNIQAKARGLTIPPDLRPAMVKELADLRRMTELLRDAAIARGDSV
jgi:hypothetical protein